MRSSKSRSRNKSNRQRTLVNIVNRVFDSSGPEGKVRGTPQQIIDKYLALARDAQLSNDRVAEQSFLQHAEHYTRMLGEAQREMAERQGQMGGQFGGQGRDDDRDWGNGNGAGNGQGQFPQMREGGSDRDNREQGREQGRDQNRDRGDRERQDRDSQNRDGQNRDQNRDGRDQNRDGQRDGRQQRDNRDRDNRDNRDRNNRDRDERQDRRPEPVSGPELSAPMAEARPAVLGLPDVVDAAPAVETGPVETPEQATPAPRRARAPRERAAAEGEPEVAPKPRRRRAEPVAETAPIAEGEAPAAGEE